MSMVPRPVVCPFCGCYEQDGDRHGLAALVVGEGWGGTRLQTNLSVNCYPSRPTPAPPLSPRHVRMVGLEWAPPLVALVALALSLVWRAFR